MDKEKLKTRVERVQETYHGRGRVFRVVWTVLGAVLVLAGLAMLVLPGPAFIFLPLGLAMLSARFAWAARLLESTIDKSADTSAIIANLNLRQRWSTIAAVALFLAAVAIVILSVT